MDEQQSEASGHVEASEGDRTGLAPVDAVLDRLAGLSDRPVSEHVAVFEHAHDQLRRALDARPDS